MAALAFGQSGGDAADPGGLVALGRAPAVDRALLPPVAGSVRCRGRGGAGGGALEGRPGVRSLNVWPKDGAEDVLIADFALGGWGMGSFTSYWGVCTTTDGRPAGWQGTDMALTEDVPGVFSWQEAKGDNAYQTWELDEGWYGYLMKF